jgi:N-succinyldiaminopimelate aminotransferase
LSFAGRLAALPPGPFARLAALLGDVRPGKDPISLAVGDPSGTVPDFVKQALIRSTASFGNYPAIVGTQDWREAAAAWLNRRFALNGAIDAGKNLLPLAGTREGLFSALFPLMPETKAGARPIVAMPNPFYQCYAAAALGSGAEPLYVPSLKENGFLPDFAGLSEALLRRLAAVYVCSPSNPEGAVASQAYWHKLFQLADQYDFVMLADECYADIWFDAPPTCSLPARLDQGFSRLLSFHSLSKRSGLPGLRSGMVAGDAALIEKFRAFRNVAGPTVPPPLLAASAAAWRVVEQLLFLL